MLNVIFFLLFLMFAATIYKVNSTESMETVVMIYFYTCNTYNPGAFRLDIEKFKAANPDKFIYTIERPVVQGHGIAMNSVVVAEVGKGPLEPFIQKNVSKGLWSLFGF